MSALRAGVRLPLNNEVLGGNRNGILVFGASHRKCEAVSPD